LDNALFQLDRVADAWNKKTGISKDNLHKEIEQLLRDKSAAPFGGLTGEPLVNVLEINLALQDRYQKSVRESK
jgi:K+-transporting ATPase ATPase C chain